MMDHIQINVGNQFARLELEPGVAKIAKRMTLEQANAIMAAVQLGPKYENMLRAAHRTNRDLVDVARMRILAAGAAAIRELKTNWKSPLT